MSINYLWHSENELNWEQAHIHYWNLLSAESVPIERKFENLDTDDIKSLSVDGFYDLLHDEYFLWKYTAKNRLATTRKQLERYKSENRMKELERIHRELFSFDLDDTRDGLEIATRILGLGTAGASGLLANLFPKYFGTVDQFVVKSLCGIEQLPEREVLLKMRPEVLKPKEGGFIINIMKAKALELNNTFNNEKWTPRKIDKILWSIDR